MAKSSRWVTYRYEQVLEFNGWFIFTTEAVDDTGLKTFRWCCSRHRDQTHLYLLWKDKNPRARKPENRYFLTRDEALLVAKASCTTD